MASVWFGKQKHVDIQFRTAMCVCKSGPVRLCVQTRTCKAVCTSQYLCVCVYKSVPGCVCVCTSQYLGVCVCVYKSGPLRLCVQVRICVCTSQDLKSCVYKSGCVRPNRNLGVHNSGPVSVYTSAFIRTSVRVII